MILSLAVLLAAIPVFAAELGGWDALVAEARARGAVETKLDKSASYVFEHKDGYYITFTRLLDSYKGRSICIIDKKEISTACVDWGSGALKIGERHDAATPWKFYSFASLDAFEKTMPSKIELFGQSIWKEFSFLMKVEHDCTHVGLSGQVIENKTCPLVAKKLAHDIYEQQ